MARCSISKCTDGFEKTVKLDLKVECRETFPSPASSACSVVFVSTGNTFQQVFSKKFETFFPSENNVYTTCSLRRISLLWILQLQPCQPKQC